MAVYPVSSELTPVDYLGPIADLVGAKVVATPSNATDIHLEFAQRDLEHEIAQLNEGATSGPVDLGNLDPNSTNPHERELEQRRRQGYWEVVANTTPPRVMILPSNFYSVFVDIWIMTQVPYLWPRVDSAREQARLEGEMFPHTCACTLT